MRVCIITGNRVHTNCHPEYRIYTTYSCYIEYKTTKILFLRVFVFANLITMLLLCHHRYRTALWYSCITHSFTKIHATPPAHKPIFELYAIFILSKNIGCKICKSHTHSQNVYVRARSHIL